MAKITPDQSIIIDAHCHTFNANDLPLKGFLTKVTLNADEKILPNIIRPLANLLAEIADNAPDFIKERNRLDSLLSPPEAGIRAVEDYALPEADEPDEEFAEKLRGIMYQMENSADKDERELFVILEKEMGFSPGEAGVRSAMDSAKSLWSSRGIISRYIKWIKLLTGYRYEITNRLINTYSSSGTTVNLFTPALIDYDRWVDDQSKTSLPEQIQLMEKNIRYQRGRIHPYFPFDPWRESEEPEGEQGSLYWLKEAVEKNGFIGAKLYPPMGYSALDNKNHSKFPNNAPKPPEDFGRSLDRAMRSLFSYCQENDIPILTHCANSNETERCFGERAHPKYWAQAVSDGEFPKLRVCLGHYGGLDSLNESDGWAMQVGSLCNDPKKNVYADISHYSAILQNDKRNSTMDNLERMLERFPNAINRIIFGTDWIMLARVRNNQDFLKVFRDAFEERFGSENCRKFMGENAARFLGLSPGQKTRIRLDTFYHSRGIPAPPWTKLV
jgi:predicted TIM-barrel fold metal-dependent hydrolase